MIDEFIGENFFLSNFYDKSPIEFEGKTYITSEHLYQAMKAEIPEEAEAIRLAPTAGKAKRLGMKCKMVKDWDNIRLQKMKDVLRIKFANEKLRTRLLATANEELIEGNNWGDKFWGIDFSDDKGENHLGKLLMELREEFKK